MASKKPEMEPRLRRDESGWYVRVAWRDRPSMQVGSFRTEDEARQWIAENGAAWLEARSELT